jgi:hypothetical protein
MSQITSKTLTLNTKIFLHFGFLKITCLYELPCNFFKLSKVIFKKCCDVYFIEFRSVKQLSQPYKNLGKMFLL